MSENGDGFPTIDDFAEVIGVDFSGARLAGQNMWLARLSRNGGDGVPWRLEELSRAGKRYGTDERPVVFDSLIREIAGSRRVLWGLDCPLGFPVLFDESTTWRDWPARMAEWGDDAAAFGRDCAERAKAEHGRMHVRRRTDTELKTPFDVYHYRIIYQTFFGIRDVVGRLSDEKKTAIIPFQYRRLAGAERVIVEVCPSSYLKRHGLPHQNYKQPGGKEPDDKRRATRRTILRHVTDFVETSAYRRKVMMENGGGDALDAVLAALSTAERWAAVDHDAVRRDDAYRCEGFIFS
ncbi:MAG: DUF429 domain-containing protein [Planctomycetota bacterium]